MFMSIFMTAFGVLCIVGLIFENKLVEFEDRIIEKFKNRKK